jgi:hypothetical protein
MIIRININRKSFRHLKMLFENQFLSVLFIRFNILLENNSEVKYVHTSSKLFSNETLTVLLCFSGSLIEVVFVKGIN